MMTTTSSNYLNYSLSRFVVYALSHPDMYMLVITIYIVSFDSIALCCIVPLYHIVSTSAAVTASTPLRITTPSQSID